MSFRYVTEDILSPEDVSCNSSHFSNKSEKNMSDFEGEEGLSDAELEHINQHPYIGSIHRIHQLQPYIECMSGNVYNQKHSGIGGGAGLPKGIIISPERI